MHGFLESWPRSNREPILSPGRCHINDRIWHTARRPRCHRDWPAGRRTNSSQRNRPGRHVSIGLPGAAQVAACDRAPAGWAARQLHHRPQSAHRRRGHQRRRAVPPAPHHGRDQLALALAGEADCAYAISFIVTNLRTRHSAELIAVEN